MAAPILLAVAGLWLVLQATAGRLGARALSWRASVPGDPARYDTAPSSPATTSSTGTVAGTIAGEAIAPGAGRLTDRQVATLALQALGGNCQAATIAVAIAYRESGFNPRAHNTRYPDDSVGLWQINRLGVPGRFTVAELMDPARNAAVMAEFSRGGTYWHPWTLGRGVDPPNGLTYMAQARAAVAAVAPGCR